MKISVIIPTYNREAQVVRAIASVLAQSVPVYEVIVVDDGSSDQTVPIVRKEFGESVILIEQQNQGVSVARNRGIEAATGEWVAFLDSDDFWMEDKIDLQLEALRLGGSDAGLCFTDNRYWGNPQMEFSRFEETGFQCSSRFGVLERPIHYILTGREPFFTSTLLIRRSLLMEYGGFDHRLIIREDTDLLFRLALKTAFAFVDKPLVLIDRTPSREEGLCKLYGTRIDTLFECSERLYKNWLSMCEVKGSEFEQPIRVLLRLSHYDSAEAKIHELRFRAALRELREINRLGEWHVTIAKNLFVRKIQKWVRRRKASQALRMDKKHERQFDAV
ncbi:MAG TPA: glycosyltransferase family A protein [Terracidiphilus sp.]|jgi:glycosyltransferase involved in cell wall biosynthesis